MSNPAVITLVEGKIRDGSHIRVEDNLGEAIHIHVNNMTFYLTVNEFEEMVEGFYDAAKELLLYHNIQIEKFDLSSLDWNWLRKYDQITSIKIKNKKIKELYTADIITKNGVQCWHYVPIGQSKNYRALCGEKEVLSQYNEFNLYQQNSESRLNDIVEIIKQYGYPYDNKYIVTNQHGRIYDGAHRAAGLLYMHDENYEIPVIEISFINDEPIDAFNKKAKKIFIKKRVKTMARAAYHLPLNIFRRIKTSFCRKKKNVATFETQEVRNTKDYDAFQKQILLSGFRCFRVEKQKINCKGVKIADSILIVDETQFDTFQSEMSLQGFHRERNSFYDEYYKLYGLDNPVLFRLADRDVLTYSKLACKSLDFDALIPLDSSITSEGWERVAGITAEVPEADSTITSLLIIVDALLEQRKFTEPNRVYLIHHKFILGTDRMREMLGKVFFNYCDSLISLP